MIDPSASPILLIAPRGMLGRAWHELLTARGLDFDALGRPDLDLTDPRHVARIDPRYRMVINCAAWTDVDGAEADEAGATRLNGEAVGRLADRCRAISATLVHYSTDYVFDGRASSPYRTDHPRSPINAYGRSKAAGEAAIEASGCDHLTVRTSWLYAPWGRNFVRTMARLTRDKDAMSVVHDQRGRPTSCEHLARTSIAIIERGSRGFQHITDAGECTWFEFTVEIARQLGHPCTITPCTTADFPRPAQRPAYSVLDLTETQAALSGAGSGWPPPWQTSLSDVLRRLEGA